MADEEASNIVSVLSSPSEPSTLRSTVLQEEAESSPSHSLESPIKRKPGTKASAGRAQSKKLRQSVGQASKQPLGSIPEHGQQPVTLEDLAGMTAQMQESPVRRDPAMPSDHPEATQERPHVMTEIDLDND